MKIETKKGQKKPVVLYTERDFTKLERKDDGAISFELSNELPDRYDTIIPFEMWNFDNYNENPILAYNHYTGTDNPDNIIGSGRIEIDEKNKKIYGFPQFEPAEINKKAAKIEKKVNHGTLRAVSVGFIPIEAGHWGVESDDENPNIYYFGQVELVEFSIVDIPANPQALKQSLAMRSFLEDTKQIKEKTKKNGNKRLLKSKNRYYQQLYKLQS